MTNQRRQQRWSRQKSLMAVRGPWRACECGTRPQGSRSLAAWPQKGSPCVRGGRRPCDLAELHIPRTIALQCRRDMDRDKGV
jgi:hypothetical protein